jgi:hypothetical protein
MIRPSRLEYGAAPHDYMYRVVYDKRVADTVFRMLCRADKATWIEAQAAYRAVQFGAWGSWFRHRRARRKEAS